MRREITLLTTTFLLLALIQPVSAYPSLQTITVSGTITDINSNLLSDIQVTVAWEGGNEVQITGGAGTYSVSNVTAGGEVLIFVRPPIEQRLSHRNWSTLESTSNITKNFQLEPGSLLSGVVTMPDGTPPPNSIYLTAYPVTLDLAADESLGENTNPLDGSFQMVLPQDIHVLRYDGIPSGTYAPRTVLDLTTDVTGYTITLSAEPVPYVRTDPPPDASRIQIGPADDAGIATITGSTGAVPGLHSVLLLDLDTGLYTTTVASADGSFSAGLFAPPGASVVVKYAYDPTQFVGLPFEVIALPTTILRAPLPATLAGDGDISFGAVGSAGAFDSPIDPETEKLIMNDSRWWMLGTMSTSSGSLHVAPGQTVELSGTLRLASGGMGPGYDPSSLVSTCDVVLVPLFDGSGNQLENLEPGLTDHIFMSRLSTPTGLPIERDSHELLPDLASVSIGSLYTVTTGVVESTFAFSFTVPITTAEGFYVPRIGCLTPDLPTVEKSDPADIWYLGRASHQAYLPILRVGDALTPHLITMLLSNVYTGGARGVRARQDAGRFDLSTMVVYQPDRFIAPRIEPISGKAIRHQLEPFLPMTSFAERSLPAVPLVPFDFPSGQLEVTVEKPDGTLDTIGPLPFAQSYSFQPVTLDGTLLHLGAPFVGDIYSLSTMDDDTLRYEFDQYGHHVIAVTGVISDVWGHSYTLGGTYDVWVARELDLDPGQLPTTPYEVGDAFSPALQVSPRVPADVEVKLTLLPDSDPAQTITRTVRGQANRFGYFHPGPATSPITLTAAGEFRVDVHATYTDTQGTMWAGSVSWGNVVETPNTPLVVHGRRGIDNAPNIGQAWFLWKNLSADDQKSHIYYPFHRGDVIWANELEAPGGDSLIPAITIQDTEGSIQSIIEARNALPHSEFSQGAGTFSERVSVGEIPLFNTASSGVYPDRYPDQIDQWGYSYRSSERPGVRVRELVSEDSNVMGYWRYNDMYGRQIGMGLLGDLPNDYKFQFGGTVFRIISETAPINEYAIYSAMWVLLPTDDLVGSRVMPPYQGMGGGPTDGGPLMTLKGEDIDVFFLPTGVRPGSVLEVGDAFSFSGHVAPPLDSRVMVTITSPSDVVVKAIDGHANKVGWFYDPTGDFTLNEPGAWSVDVWVEHDRVYEPGGLTPTSHNTGTVLGASQGRYTFYVVEPTAPRLSITAPSPGFLTWPDNTVAPVNVVGTVPAGASGAVVSYTIAMPGVVLEQGTVAPTSNTFTVSYDPVTLHDDFPNIDLSTSEEQRPGLSDEVLITLLMIGGDGSYRANTITLFGEEVFVEQGTTTVFGIYLPVVLKDW